MTFTNINSFNSISPPLQIPGCAFWLDAADSSTLVLSNTTVTRWRDKITGTLGANVGTPTYTIDSNNNACVRFAGTDYFTFGTTLLNISTEPFTIISVARNNSNLGIKGIIGRATATSSWWLGYNSVNIQSQYYTSSSSINNFTSATNTLCNTIIIGTDISRTATLTTSTNFNNGSNIGSASGATSNASGAVQLNIGRGPNTFNLVGDIFEILVYVGSGTTSPLSVAQRQYIEGYLAWKWGTNTSLISINPYRVAAPYNFYNFITNFTTVPQTQFTSITYPTNIPGLVLWLDGADTATIQYSSGTNVSNWLDKSGFGNNARQTTSANQPAYLNSGVYFQVQGSNPSFLNITNLSLFSNVSYGYTFIVYNAAQPNSNVINNNIGIFSVATALGNARYSVILGTAAGVLQQGIFGRAADSNSLSAYFSGAGTYRSNTTLMGTFGIQYALSNVFINTNGSNVLSTTFGGTQPATSATNSTSITINSAQLGQNLSNSYVYEMLVYTQFLSPIQIQQIEGYLASKWSLSSTLPATHPFLTYTNPFYNIQPTLPTIGPTISYQPQGFSPLSVPGLALWLDAADQTTVVLSGSTVTQWNDKSGNNRNATPSNSPTYTGSSIDLRNGSRFTGPLSISAGTLLTTSFCVAVSPATFNGDTNRLLSAWSGTTNDFQAPTGFAYAAILPSGALYAYRNVGANMTSTIGSNVLFMQTTITFSNGSFFTSLNGNYPSGNPLSYGSNINAASTNLLTNYFIGSTNLATAQRWFGQVNEFLIFNRSLSQAEYQQVEGYLAWKWGLTGRLPSGHPNQYMPP